MWLVTVDLTNRVMAEIGSLLQMSNSISDALGDTKNVLQAFGTFFMDFIKGMIFRLVAATYRCTSWI